MRITVGGSMMWSEYGIRKFWMILDVVRKASRIRRFYMLRFARGMNHIETCWLWIERLESERFLVL